MQPRRPNRLEQLSNARPAQRPRPSFPYRLASSVACFLAALVVLLAPARTHSAVQEVRSIGITVNDLEREVRFFTQVLAFEEVTRSEVVGSTVDDLLRLDHVKLKVAELKLGDEQVSLTEHLVKGHAIPLDSRSYDHWFQHVAIVVSDMDRAYSHLRQHNVRHVSTGPQTLPEWNTNAAGIKAFYFRDPEDHVLEVIWFPPGKGDPKWQQPTRRLFLGIDHTAIVVSDTDRSLAFYRDLLGCRVAGESENFGVEQEHLNQVFGARLRITALRANHGPGIEFLEYLAPPGGRSLPSDARPSDLIFWRTELAVDRLDSLVAGLKENGAQFLSRGVETPAGHSPGQNRSIVVRDPDGHALQFSETHSAVTSATSRQ